MRFVFDGYNINSSQKLLMELMVYYKPYRIVFNNDELWRLTRFDLFIDKLNEKLKADISRENNTFLENLKKITNQIHFMI